MKDATRLWLAHYRHEYTSVRHGIEFHSSWPMERRFARLAAAYWVLAADLDTTLCKWFGHKLTVDYADPENGSETISCTRCSWCETVYF